MRTNFKTGAFVLASLFLFVCTTGCGSVEQFVEENAVEINGDVNAEALLGNRTDREQVGTNDETIYIWTDPETGVQYIVYREKTMNAGFGGITPRLNPDGTICVVSSEELETE